MIKAVLFDLDGTLLDIDLDGFLADYFRLLGPTIADLIGDGMPATRALSAVLAATRAMSVPHPGVTNRTAFNETFLDLTGMDLADDRATAALELFYRQRFPALQNTHGPRPGARDAVARARELGMLTALATNPIFPLAAIEERARWALLDLADFAVVTSYESMTACKPHGAYFLEVADRLGVEASECLMVGDDPDLDLAAGEVGMMTYYVGSGTAAAADWSGDLAELAVLLPRLVS